MVKQHLILDFAIAFLIILFLQFFSFSRLPDPVKFSGVLAGGLLLVAIFFVGTIFQRNVEKTPLDWIVFLYILSMFISAFMANLYWDQAFSSSLKSYQFFYIYFLYFALVYLRVSEERVEQILIFLFLISILIFAVDYKTFPDPLFTYRSEERRNGMTIFFYGQGFTFLGGFYFLNKFFKDRKILYLIFFGIASICLFLLTQSRMNLLALALGFFILLLTSDFKKKYLITLILMVGALIFYSTSEVFNGIKNESRDQAEFYKEDIRVLSQSYFLTELQGGVPTMVLGNGVPSKESNLGIESVKGNSNGFWTADVGMTGIYSYFGIFGVMMWLILFYTVFQLRNERDAVYLVVYFLAVLITVFTGYSLFDPGYMPATVLALYLLRCKSVLPDDDEEVIL